MAFQWMRRALLALAPAALVVVAACSSGTIESQFKPARIVAFGDALSDMGNTGTRYTVNDGTTVWPQLVALNYGVPLDKSANGGTDYAVGNARVVIKPDAAGNNATPTIKEQIDTFFTANPSFNAGDLVTIQGGTGDIIVQMRAFQAGTITSDQLVANVKQAGVDLATQAKRLVAAGATHVLVMGVYDLGRTPWAISIGQQALLSTVSTAFNDAVEVALVDEGNNMLYVDAALLFNLMTSSPPSYSFANVTDVVCTSTDPGPGIGIGAGQVNSALCTPSTIVTGAIYDQFLWADAVYPTPLGHSHLADYIFSHLRSRW
jgi:outer membrane lipase/esterase